MTEFTLWRKRLAFLRSLRWKEFQMIADWTVWLYFIVPGVVIGSFLYREVLIDPPTWFKIIPSTLLFLFPFFRGIRSFYRIHLHPADVNFLLAGPWNERKFVYFSMGWQWIKELGVSLLFVLLFFPYLQSQLSFGIGDSLLLAVLYWLIQLLFLNINWFFRKYGRLIFYVAQFLYMPLIILGIIAIEITDVPWNSPFLFSAGGIGLFLSTLLLWKQKKWDWAWLIQDSARRNSPLSISFIMESEEIKNKKYTRLPFLPFMKKSWSDTIELRPISKELSLKIFFRRSSKWKYILYQLSWGSIGILLMKTFEAKAFLLTVVVLLMYQLLKTSQAEVEKRLLHRVSPVNLNLWREGRNQGLLILVAGFALFFAMVLILSVTVIPPIPALSTLLGS